MAEDRAQRRLAAILAADVVGYSRLMGEDEEATLGTLKANREIIDGLIGRHQGRVFGSAGDTIEYFGDIHGAMIATALSRRERRRPGVKARARLHAVAVRARGRDRYVLRRRPRAGRPVL